MPILSILETCIMYCTYTHVYKMYFSRECRDYWIFLRDKAYWINFNTELESVQPHNILEHSSANIGLKLLLRLLFKASASLPFEFDWSLVQIKYARPDGRCELYPPKPLPGFGVLLLPCRRYGGKSCPTVDYDCILLYSNTAKKSV